MTAFVRAINKVNQETIKAFLTGKEFEKVNRKVVHNGGSISLFLYKTEIAQILLRTGVNGLDELYIRNTTDKESFNTKTTNALLNSLPKVNISNKRGLKLDGKDWDGKWVLIHNAIN